jgi:hypothetical protein
MSKTEKDHAKEMYDKGFRDGERGGGQAKAPSDRTYGDYVNDAKHYREGVAAGETARKNRD